MIVSCPACSKRIKLDRQRFAGKRVKLRCVGCGEIFQAEIPPINSTPSPSIQSGAPMVLVAHSDVALCETVGEVLNRHALTWVSCHDGDEALRLMDSSPPRVVLVDVALPGLFAFEVVDKVRRRQGLESIKIILLSSVYNKMAYKRRPHSLYGADDYIEKHHIPTDLIAKINRLVPGQGGGLAPATTENEVQVKEDAWKIADSLNSRLLEAEESESAIAKNDALVLEKAQRLARIIASDIALYNQNKVEEGIRTDRFFELLAAEVAEGRKHFMEKIPPDVPGRETILQEAFESLISRRRLELQL